MSAEATLATDILVYATLGIDFAVILLFVGFIFARGMMLTYFARWNICARCLAALVALTAFFGSIIYSVVTGFQGCALCLASRTLMAVLIVVLASPLFLKGKERIALVVGKVLAVLGLLVSGYQYVLQWLSLTGTHLPCPAIEGLPSCDRIYFIEFGFITIPFVAFSAFALILTLLVLAGKQHTTPTAPLA